MCIIAVKKAGVEFPSIETMETCFNHNPDGAGFCYAKDGKVHIFKGFMSWQKYASVYEKIQKMDKKIPFIFHFRIGTHGKTRSPAYCHPFPSSTNVEDLLATKVISDIGIAHNGIIHSISMGTKLSDTMEFIGGILSPLLDSMPDIDAYPNSTIIENMLGAGNKLAVMYHNGVVQTYGNFVEDKNGIMYSNESYKAYSFYPSDNDVEDRTFGYYNKKCPRKKTCFNYGWCCDMCNGNALYNRELTDY